jgi:hypothetical protein
MTIFGTTESAHAVSLKNYKKDNISELELLENAKEHFKGDFLQRIVFKNEIEANMVWIEIINNKIQNMLKEN